MCPSNRSNQQAAAVCDRSPSSFLFCRRLHVRSLLVHYFVIFEVHQLKEFMPETHVHPSMLFASTIPRRTPRKTTTTTTTTTAETPTLPKPSPDKCKPARLLLPVDLHVVAALFAHHAKVARCSTLALNCCRSTSACGRRRRL